MKEKKKYTVRVIVGTKVLGYAFTTKKERDAFVKLVKKAKLISTK